METGILSLQGLYDKLRMQADLLNESIEPSKCFLFLSLLFISALGLL